MRRKSRVKLLTVIIPVLLIAATGAAGTTYAVLQTHTSEVQNLFAGGAVNIAVIENDNIQIPLENEENYAGSFDEISDKGVDKKVQIQNLDSEEYPTTDTFVRVRLVPVFRDAGGASVPVKAGELKENIVYTYGNEDGNWVTQEVDGETYFYYKEILEPDELTSALITKVAYTGEVPEGAVFELQVLAEGVAANQPNVLENTWGLSNGFAGMNAAGNF